MGFLTEKVKEKPDPNSKTAIDFDSKVTAERDKQIKVSAPNTIIFYPSSSLNSRLHYHRHDNHHQGDRAELDGGDDHRQGRQLHQAPQGDQRLLHPVVTEGKGQYLA